MAVFHRMLVPLSTFHETGKAALSATPRAPAPRKPGQFSPHRIPILQIATIAHRMATKVSQPAQGPSLVLQTLPDRSACATTILSRAIASPISPESNIRSDRRD